MASPLPSTVGSAWPSSGEHLDDVVTALIDAVVVVDERAEGAVTVRVRPVGSLLLDGSPSLGSVVEVVSADRQFIVTSVSSELFRLGLRAAAGAAPGPGLPALARRPPRRGRPGP